MHRERRGTASGGRRGGRPAEPANLLVPVAVRGVDVRAAAVEPVADRPVRGLEGDARPRDGLGANAWISSASGFRRGAPPTTRASKASTTTAASSRE